MQRKGMEGIKIETKQGREPKCSPPKLMRSNTQGHRYWQLPTHKREKGILLSAK